MHQLEKVYKKSNNHLLSSDVVLGISISFSRYGSVSKIIQREDRYGSVDVSFSIFSTETNKFHFKSLSLLDLTFHSYKSDLPWFKTGQSNGVFCEISASQKTNSALNLAVKTNFKPSSFTWITKQKTVKDICLLVIKDKQICKVLQKYSSICQLYTIIHSTIRIMQQMLGNGLKYLILF